MPPGGREIVSRKKEREQENDKLTKRKGYLTRRVPPKKDPCTRVFCHEKFLILQTFETGPCRVESSRDRTDWLNYQPLSPSADDIREEDHGSGGHGSAGDRGDGQAVLHPL